MGRATWGRSVEAEPVGKGGSSSSRFPKRRRRITRPHANLRQKTYQPEEEEEDSEECQEVEMQSEEQAFEGAEARTDAGGKGKMSEPVILNDPEALDCPVCFEPLTEPVFQCENGHIACSFCCTKVLENKCPACRSTIGYRNRAIERVLESLTVSCKNTNYGCKKTMKYNKKYDHEKECCCAPCSCPVSDCYYIGSLSQLCQHFHNEHKNSAVQFLYNSSFGISLNVNDKSLVLQEGKDGLLFTLNNTRTDHGNAISIHCIAPKGMQLCVKYDITATIGRDADLEEQILTFQSFTLGENEQPESLLLTRFLVVPSYFFSLKGQLELDICMWRRSPPENVQN